MSDSNQMQLRTGLSYDDLKIFRAIGICGPMVKEKMPALMFVLRQICSPAPHMSSDYDETISSCKLSNGDTEAPTHARAVADLRN